MKILVYVEKSDVRGGIEVFAERHVARLRAEGHEVETVKTIDGRRPTAGRQSTLDFSTFDEVVVHKCSDVATLEKFPPEKTVCYIHDHDPICPRSYAYTPLKRNCSRAGGIWPCIFCAPLCRNWRPALGRVFSQRRRIAAMAKFSKLVVISEFMKSRLVANGLDAAKIEVKPPTIAFQLTHSQLTHSQPTTFPIDLLYVGQLIRGKGVQLLIRAMARMKSARTLDIVGRGNMEGELRELAAKLGVADRVRFDGFQANPQDWMRAAKCVVVPSFWQEPYGLVAAEAVALGRPVVAFAVGGLPEACHGRATLVPPGDVDALAAALDGQMPEAWKTRTGVHHVKVRAFVFIDALGWRQVEKYDFLRDLLPNRRKIEMQFGYSCTAIPTILTGKRPSEHGHLAFYDYAPEKSPFKRMRFLAPFLRPRSFWRRGRVRHQLSKLIKRLYGFTGYFQLYGVPIERLPKLDYCEKKDLFVPGGLAPVKNLADVWGEQGLRYLISDWRLPESENFRIAADAFRSGAVDRAFVYSAAFDALQHDNVGRDDVLRPKVEKYADTIRALHAALVEGGRPFELTVFSDHGMTPLRGTVDAPSALAKAGLSWGEDYASAIDSTMARFWWLGADDAAKAAVASKVKSAMSGFPGHWLTEGEMRRNGIWRDDHKFGDAVFLADPGVQFCPSDMGVKPLNGMHGYDPADIDSLACWLSTEPVPDGVTRVCDYFSWISRP